MNKDKTNQTEINEKRSVLKTETGNRRFKVIACEILFREVCLSAARSRHVIDPVFLPKGLHDIGEEKMRTRLQKEIDAVDPNQYDAILMVYGLCNNGVRGLKASLPLVIPRAHDCITLLLGSKETYQAYFDTHPGTYFKSPGWIERDQGFTDLEEGQAIPSQLGMSRSYEEYVAEYGEENAAYLMEVMGDWLQQYKRLAYIDTGTGDAQKNQTLTRNQAEERGWEYETLTGSTRLIDSLFDGQWPENEFLIVKPGQSIKPSYESGVVAAE